MVRIKIKKSNINDEKFQNFIKKKDKNITKTIEFTINEYFDYLIIKENFGNYLNQFMFKNKNKLIDLNNKNISIIKTLDNLFIEFSKLYKTDFDLLIRNWKSEKIKRNKSKKYNNEFK